MSNNNLWSLFQGLTRVQKYLIGFLAFLVVLLLVFIYLTRQPKFPNDFPSSENIKVSQNDKKAQQTFFNGFTSFIRSNHGGIVVAKEVNLTAQVSGDKGSSFMEFRQEFKFFDQELVFDLTSKFASQYQLGYSIKKISQKQGGPLPDHQYEIDFLKDEDLWVRVQVSTGKALKLQAEKPSYASTEKEEFETSEEAVRPGERRMILIIDDLGNNLQVFRDLMSLEFDLTFSVLPHQSRSVEISELAHERGREVILHLPMQPLEWPKYNPGAGALLLDDDAETILDKLESGLKSVPHAVGTNNHMGSAFIQYKEGLEEVMKFLGKNGLFFLDSKTAPGQLAKETARQNQVPYFSRDIFIDNIQNEQSIIKQLDKAARMAERRGTVIVIGHPYPITFQTLAKYLPVIEQQGIKIVRVSSLLRS